MATASPTPRPSPQRAPEGFVYQTLAIHREARRAVRRAAAEAEVPIYRMFHEALCRGLGREDLIGPPSHAT